MRETEQLISENIAVTFDYTIDEENEEVDITIRKIFVVVDNYYYDITIKSKRDKRFFNGVINLTLDYLNGKE